MSRTPEPSASIGEVEERFRTMADHAPVLLWMAGTDGRCEFFNQGWLAFTGRPLEEELGNGWAGGVHPEDFQRCMHAYLDAFVERRPFSMHYRLRRHDGAYRWIFDQGAPRFETNGAFAGYIGSCVDVTEQREAHDTLERVNADLEELVKERTAIAEARQVLLREVHHRIKNDLQLISSLLNMQGRDVDHPGATAALEECQRRVHTVAQIHEHIYRSDNFVHSPFSTSVRDLVAGVFRIGAIPPGTVSLEVDAEDDIPLTVERAVPSGLILTELVTNALKHAFPAGRNGTVRVSVRKQEDQIVLAVSDDGVGTVIEKEMGDSLGWQLIRAFAEQLEADVNISHDSGTTVSVRFPLDGARPT
jgi:PAS domain S-box-containing protein